MDEVSSSEPGLHLRSAALLMTVVVAYLIVDQDHAHSPVIKFWIELATYDTETGAIRTDHFCISFTTIDCRRQRLFTTAN